MKYGIGWGVRVTVTEPLHYFFHIYCSSSSCRQSVPCGSFLCRLLCTVGGGLRIRSTFFFFWLVRIRLNYANRALDQVEQLYSYFLFFVTPLSCLVFFAFPVRVLQVKVEISAEHEHEDEHEGEDEDEDGEVCTSIQKE